MPKRKAPPLSTLPHRHGKHPRLQYTDTPSETINILLTNPSTLSHTQVSHQKNIVSQKLHYATKLVARALKVGRGFERQRLGKKLKAAREARDEAGVGRVEREMGVLKEVELEGVARGQVWKGVRKGVKGGGFWPGDEEGSMDGRGKEEGKEQEIGEEMRRARNNVVAALCNMKPVREAMKAAVEMVREVAVSKWTPEKEEGEDGENEDEDEVLEERQKDEDEDEDEENDDTTTEGEWSEWDGIEDSTRPCTPNPVESEDDSKPTKSPKQSIKTDTSLIDPSRGSDDEWSGEEDDDLDAADELDEEDGDGDEGESTADDGQVGPEEESLSEDEIIERLGKLIAPRSDEEEEEEGGDLDFDSDAGSDSNTSYITSKPHPTKPAPTTTPKLSTSTSTSTKKPKPKTKPKTNANPPTPSLTPTPSPTPPSTKKKPLPTTKSTFLPSLLGGYISGSESDLDNDPTHPHKSKKSAAQKKPRKNRMGQQARRALAEKKYKENARHVRLGLGNGKRDDRDIDNRKDDSRRGGGGFGRGGGRGGGGGRFTEGRRGRRDGDGDGGRKGEERKKDTDGPLHPSWEAARKAKEKKAMAEFQGRKIKFD